MDTREGYIKAAQEQYRMITLLVGGAGGDRNDPGREIEAALKILGPIGYRLMQRSELPHAYVEAYRYAMSKNDVSVLRLLTEQNFFNCQSREFLNDDISLQILREAVEGGNAEAMAVFLRSTSTLTYYKDSKRTHAALTGTTMCTVLWIANELLGGVHSGPIPPNTRPARARVRSGADANVAWKAIATMFEKLRGIVNIHERPDTFEGISAWRRALPIALLAILPGDATVGLLLAAIHAYPLHQAAAVLLVTMTYDPEVLVEAGIVFAASEEEDGLPQEATPWEAMLYELHIDTFSLLGNAMRNVAKVALLAQRTMPCKKEGHIVRSAGRLVKAMQDVKDASLPPDIHLSFLESGHGALFAYQWAMIYNHTGILTILDTETTMFTGTYRFNDAHNLKIFKLSIQMGSSGAMAFMLNAIGHRRDGGRFSDATIAAIVLEADATLSSSHCNGTHGCMFDRKADWLSIGVMFKALQKFKAPYLGDRGITKAELQPIKSSVDAMEGLLFAAICAEGGTRHWDISILLETVAYRRDTLATAVALMGEPDIRYGGGELDMAVIALMARAMAPRPGLHPATLYQILDDDDE
jgi:hypothetical protein